MTKSNFRFLAFCLLFLAIQSSVLGQQVDAQDSSKTITNTIAQSYMTTDSIGSPVILGHDTLFFVRHSIGAISIRQRAIAISENVAQIQENFDVDKDTIIAQMTGGISSINYNENVLIHVTPEEAVQHNASVESLGLLWANAIDQGLKSDISQNETIFQYAISVGIFLAFVFLLNFFLKWVFKKVNKYIESKKSKYLRGIRIKKFEILDAADELELVFKITLVIRFLCLLLLAYITFPIFFSLFPATEPIAYKLIGFIYNPLVSAAWSFIHYLPNLFSIIVIVYIFRFILKYLRLFSQRVESGRLKIAGFYSDWAGTTYTLIRFTVIALGVVMVFPYLPGAQSDVFKGVSVFIGVLFSIGSTSVVGNLVAGLVLTYMRPFKIGDRIKIGEIEGEIVEKTAFVLRIKTPKNEHITLPNANVLNAHIVNYNRSFNEGGVILFTDVTIGYDVPWRKVHDLLLKAADLTDYLEKDPKPFVLQKSLDDFSVAYQINAYSKRPLYKDLIDSLVNQNIQDIFAEAGVEILSPNYMAQRDGNASTIPDVDEPKDETPPTMPTRPDTPDMPDRPA